MNAPDPSDWDESSAFTVLPGGNRDWLIVCDHASAHLPPAFGDLGLSEADRTAHIAWDIGALNVAKRLAERLDAPLVASGCSRLLIDCNRYPDAQDSIPATSDGRTLEGNAALSDAGRTARFLGLYRPYHARIARLLDEAEAAGHVPALLSIHSCTAAMDGVYRPWPIGIAWARDARMAAPVIDALRRESGLTIGDNQPYALLIGDDFTTPEHAMARGLPHLQVEFRNDGVASAADAARHADALYDALGALRETADWRQRVDHLRPEDGVVGAKKLLGLA